jgi:hypothetical protein
MLGNQLEGAALLGLVRLVVRVHEDIGIEKATSAHESRLD